MLHMNTSIENSDRKIISTRLFDTPRETVFKAWTDPKLLAEWWGPNGFTNTFEEFDLSPGGHWRFVMHGPDGKNYRNHSTFIEITSPERIVFDHVSPPTFRVTATFENESGKTEITFQMVFESAEVCANLKHILVPSNEQNFDRLEALLKKIKSSQ
jgi:uncharacterized protein YndB with AHSA1/START domain